MASQGGRIQVSLRLERTRGAEIIASLEFINRSRDRFHLLKWLVFPAGRIDAERFEIQVDGVEPRYTGILAKRDPPQADDFGIIGPGQVVRSRVVLSQAYRLPPRGLMTVTYVASNPALGTQPLERLRSNTVTFDLASDVSA
jgi:hypothetical protein